MVFALWLSTEAREDAYFPLDLRLARWFQASGFPPWLALFVDAIGGGFWATLMVILVAIALLLASGRDVAMIFVGGSLLGLLVVPLKIAIGRV